VRVAATVVSTVHAISFLLQSDEQCNVALLKNFSNTGQPIAPGAPFGLPFGIRSGHRIRSFAAEMIRYLLHNLVKAV
jgi:hypothetical protein